VVIGGGVGEDEDEDDMTVVAMILETIVWRGVSPGTKNRDVVMYACEMFV
jgi:hypothetical protein